MAKKLKKPKLKKLKINKMATGDALKRNLVQRANLDLGDYDDIKVEWWKTPCDKQSAILSVHGVEHYYYVDKDGNELFYDGFAAPTPIGRIMQQNPDLSEEELDQIETMLGEAEDTQLKDHLDRIGIDISDWNSDELDVDKIYDHPNVAVVHKKAKGPKL